jgi:hypothetical protein
MGFACGGWGHFQAEVQIQRMLIALSAVFLRLQRFSARYTVCRSRKTGSRPKTRTLSEIQNERYVKDEYDFIDLFNCTKYFVIIRS